MIEHCDVYCDFIHVCERVMLHVVRGIRLAQHTDFTDLARMNEIDGEETDIEVSNSLIAKVARS